MSVKEYIKSLFFRANEQYISFSFFGVVVGIWLAFYMPYYYIKQKIAYRKLLKEANKSERYN